MKIDKKDYPFWILIAAAIFVVVFLVTNRGDNGDAPESTPTPSATPVEPTPQLIIELGSDYENLVIEFEGRRILLNESCTLAQPSNISFPNMTQIMLDNRLSPEPRTVTIGDRVYNLVAHGWYLTTLYSAELPANLKMSCGELELGQIGIE